MFIVWPDPEEASFQVFDWSAKGDFLSGGCSVVAAAPTESLLNPRPMGFGREDPYYIPVWFESEAP